MAAPLDLAGLQGTAATSALVTVEAAVVTGFEPCVAEEVLEVLGVQGNVTRGRVVFDLPPERLGEVLGLRCPTTIYLLLGHDGDYTWEGSVEEQMAAVEQFVASKLCWAKGLQAWAQATGFQGDLYPLAKDKDKERGDSSAVEKAEKPENCDNSEESPVAKQARLDDVLTFRATCYRSGEKSAHAFPSTLVASTVGGAVADSFGWKVKMKGYHLELVVNCNARELYCALTLNNSSLGNRTITEFGLCTLRPNTAACLARLAGLQAGEVVVDPMAGTGSIPLEGALGFPATFHLAGELAAKSVRSCRVNMEGVVAKNCLEVAPKVDALQWDCIRGNCLRDGSVDVIITDLPFGRRSGSKADNKKLYPDMLVAMARVVRPEVGRAVLLTQDKTSMFASLARVAAYWARTRVLTTNIGGLTALVFVLARTSELWTHPKGLKS